MALRPHQLFVAPSSSGAASFRSCCVCSVRPGKLKLKLVGVRSEKAEEEKKPKKLSEQSSWEAKDAEGKDYLYRLGKEADNMNIAVGARAGVIDDLFTGQFLGRDCQLLSSHFSLLILSSS